MNGNWYKNGGKETCVEQAYRQMTQGGDVLDALIAGVNILELDPEEDSVGYGGLPNADGVVQLDSCCMHGPKRRAGGVAGARGRAHAVEGGEGGDGSDRSPPAGRRRRAGVRPATSASPSRTTSTPSTRARRGSSGSARRTRSTISTPTAGRKPIAGFSTRCIDEGLLNSRVVHGTINCDGINAKGEICGVTTTSGLAWKIPGRVGDSPILGAGLYVDGAVGAAGSTGRGEANLYNLSSYLIVENLRRGMHPKDAGLDALKRVRSNTVERRLRRANGDPNFSLTFYILNAQAASTRESPCTPRTTTTAAGPRTPTGGS